MNREEELKKQKALLGKLKFQSRMQLEPEFMIEYELDEDNNIIERYGRIKVPFGYADKILEENGWTLAGYIDEK
jgi:hypothetical protein